MSGFQLRFLMPIPIIAPNKYTMQTSNRLLADRNFFIEKSLTVAVNCVNSNIFGDTCLSGGY